MASSAPRGRGAAGNPFPRFQREWFKPSAAERHERSQGSVATRYTEDFSVSILSRNNSPDIPFTFSLNPYRGCEHGCAYCYARPSHEYLGLSAGLDFETRIFYKSRASDLLAEAFSARSWTPQVLAMSGVTDPYQPVEQKLEITRRCLEVCHAFRNPVSLITKNAGVLRDRDVLRELASWNGVRVTISLTTLDTEIARRMEPRTASPRQRLEVIARLAEAGIPVGVLLAPMIPGLTDAEIPALLKAAAEAGAQTADYVLLRLPGAVEGIFLDWLEDAYPGRKQRVEARLRSLREGALSSSKMGERMRGSGIWADHLRQLFALGLRRSGMAKDSTPLEVGAFRRPGGMQLDLFA